MIDKSKLKLKIKNEQIKPRYLMTISGSFDEELYDKTLGLLAPYIAEKDKYSGITIYITSLGGGAHIGLALYDLFKSFNTSIYTVALGECTSAATLVFSLGEKRFVGENTICLLHSVSMGNEGYSNARDITELYSRMKVYNSKILELYKRTQGVTDDFIDFINDLFDNTREVTLNADDIIKYNFATDWYDDFNSVI